MSDIYDFYAKCADFENTEYHYLPLVVGSLYVPNKKGVIIASGNDRKLMANMVNILLRRSAYPNTVLKESYNKSFYLTTTINVRSKVFIFPCSDNTCGRLINFAEDNELDSILLQGYNDNHATWRKLKDRITSTVINGSGIKLYIQNA